MFERFEVEGLRDTHCRRRGRRLRFDGSVNLQRRRRRARRRSRAATRWDVSSYAPAPTPRQLAARGARYPAAALPYLELDGIGLPPFGTPGRAERSRARSASSTPLYARAAAVTRGTQPVRRVARARVVVPLRRRLPLRRAAAGRRGLRRSSTSSPHAGGLLPALRGRDGADAAHAGRARSRRGRLHERRVRRHERVDGHRPRRARVGRGLVPGLGLAAVRPDARPRDARRRATRAPRRLRPAGRDGLAAGGARPRVVVRPEARGEPADDRRAADRAGGGAIVRRGPLGGSALLAGSAARARRARARARRREAGRATARATGGRTGPPRGPQAAPARARRRTRPTRASSCRPSATLAELVAACAGGSASTRAAFAAAAARRVRAARPGGGRGRAVRVRTELRAFLPSDPLRLLAPPPVSAACSLARSL